MEPSFTVQGRDTPVPASAAGAKAGPQTSSSNDRSATSVDHLADAGYNMTSEVSTLLKREEIEFEQCQEKIRGIQKRLQKNASMEVKNGLSFIYEMIDKILYNRKQLKGNGEKKLNYASPGTVSGDAENRESRVRTTDPGSEVPGARKRNLVRERQETDEEEHTIGRNTSNKDENGDRTDQEWSVAQPKRTKQRKKESESVVIVKDNPSKGKE